MLSNPDLLQILDELGTQDWSPRKVTCGFYFHEARELVVLTTDPLLRTEREALRRIGGARILVEETGDPEDPHQGRQAEQPTKEYVSSKAQKIERQWFASSIVEFPQNLGTHF